MNAAGRAGMSQPDPSRRVVLVWDLPVRLFHWSLVLLLPALYFTARWNWMDMHALAGEILLALLLFRLLWGLLGSDTARFSHFLAAPRAVAGYLGHMFRREPDAQAGHNPAGGWMVALMLSLLLVQTLSGLFVQNDVADVGPFTELVPASIENAITDLHAILWNVLLGLVALHLLAVASYWLVKGQNLVVPMLSGRKMLPAALPRPRTGGLARALLLLGAAIAGAVFISLRL